MTAPKPGAEAPVPAVPAVPAVPVLPASVRAAWGRLDPPARGPKRELSLDRIVAAGVHLAGAEGLAAVSMGRVAAELGASTMALYRYVGAKDELLLLMVDAAYGAPPAADPAVDWRTGLTAWGWAERACLRANPWILQVPISGPPVLPNEMSWLERGLYVQRDTGLPGVQQLSVVLLVSSFVRAESLLATQIAAAVTDSGGEVADIMADYGRVITDLADAADFPQLHALVAEGAFDEPDDPDSEFVFGLERVLDGIAALITR